MDDRRVASKKLRSKHYGWMGPRTGPSRGSAGRGGIHRQQAVVFVVAQAAEHGGHAAQGGLGADAAGLAQGDELGRD